MSRISKGKSGICRIDQEKIMLNFHESWFMTLEFPRDVTQFYKISKDKLTNLKDPGFFFKKVSPRFPLGFFRNSPTIISYVLVSLVIVRILTKR